MESPGSVLATTASSNSSRLFPRALRWPPFLLALALLYWSMPMALLTGRINLFKRKGRNDLLAATGLLGRAFRVRALRAGKEELYRGKCMYLANHRSWADFFIDVCLTDGRGMPLSRGMVAVGFPVLVLPMLVVREIVVFNRGQLKKGKKNVEEFNRWLDERMGESPNDSLLVYPEGHRATWSHSQPLKRGMLHYAHSRNLPVQIVLSANKEAVISERDARARFGQTIVTSFSELLEPSKYHDFEEFAQEVQREWDELWGRVHTVPLEGLPELRFGSDPLNITLAQQARSAAIQTLFLAAFLSWSYFLYLLGAWVVRGLGVFAPVVVAVLVVYCGAALRESTRPVDLRGGGGGGREKHSREAAAAASTAGAASSVDTSQ